MRILTLTYLPAYQFYGLINNSKREIIIVIVLAIMIVIFGYLIYQMNSISVTLNTVLEQNSLFYERLSMENLELPQPELNSNNSVPNSNGISEQLTLNNISSQAVSESQNSGTSSSSSSSSGG